MADQIQNPHSTFPATRKATGANGRTTWTIRPRALTPEGARLAHQLSQAFSFGIGALILYALLFPLNQDMTHWLAGLALFFIVRSIMSGIFHASLRSTTHTVVSGDRFRIRRFLVWTNYDLNLPHSFALVAHAAATDEARDIDYEVRRAATAGRTIRKIPFYADSWHVCFVYDGHVVRLFDVYGRAPGEAIVNRYLYVARERAAEVKRLGEGAGNPHAGRDWHNAPGGLNDE